MKSWKYLNFSRISEVHHVLCPLFLLHFGQLGPWLCFVQNYDYMLSFLGSRILEESDPTCYPYFVSSYPQIYIFSPNKAAKLKKKPTSFLSLLGTILVSSQKFCLFFFFLRLIPILIVFQSLLSGLVLGIFSMYIETVCGKL